MRGAPNPRHNRPERPHLLPATRNSADTQRVDCCGAAPCGESVGRMQMKPFLNRALLLSSLVLVFLVAPSIGIAKERDAQNCTANRNINPNIRISACTRILKQTGAFGVFGDAAVLSNRASAYVQKGDYKQALRDLTDAVSLIEKLSDKIDEDPIGRMIAAGIFGNRGIVYLAFGRQSEAAGDFKNALLNDPTIPKYREALRSLNESE
jgi:tetratricopeptide (TPR) repeat protein